MRQRIEDLGVISERLYRLFVETSFLNKAESKHTVYDFCKYYSDAEKLEELHDQIRWHGEVLWEIYEVAAGLNYDPEEKEKP